MATSDAWRGPTRQSRLFGAPPPFFFYEAKEFVALVGKPRARVRRENESAFLSAPAIAGGGGPLELAQRANRGGGGAGLGVLLSLQDGESEQMIRRALSQHSTLHYRDYVAVRAPSTTLLRRVVPLPRYRGAG